MFLVGERSIVRVNPRNQIVHYQLSIGSARRSAGRKRVTAASARYRASFHHDNEGPDLAGRKQIVKDQIGATHLRPNTLILTPAVLQVQDRVPGFDTVVVC